jgi:hypothetical protein
MPPPGSGRQNSWFPLQHEERHSEASSLGTNALIPSCVWHNDVS